MVWQLVDSLVGSHIVLGDGGCVTQILAGEPDHFGQGPSF
jgi:hypothetical protein